MDMKSREKLMQWASQFEDGSQRVEAVLNGMDMIKRKNYEEGE